MWNIKKSLPRQVNILKDIFAVLILDMQKEWKETAAEAWKTVRYHGPMATMIALVGHLSCSASKQEIGGLSAIL